MGLSTQALGPAAEKEFKLGGLRFKEGLGFRVSA